MKIYEKNRTDYEIVVDDYFAHVPINKREHNLFMKDRDYAIGFNLGYANPNLDNPFDSGSIKWAAWFQGKDNAIADRDFWNRYKPAIDIYSEQE